MNDTSSPWNARRVLVTGCTGFLGTAVVREILCRGAEVVGLVRSRAAAAAFTRHRLSGKVHVVHGRAEDLFRVHSAMAVHEVRVVFHLVAADAARATTTVLDAARRYDSRVPVVLARPHGSPTTAATGQPVGVAQFGALFGPGDRDTSHVIPGTVAGERDAMRGDGSARDFVPVRDAARGCVMLAERLLAGAGARVESHTFRTGWDLTDGEMAAAVRETLAGRHVLSAASPADDLGWMPSRSLADALAETVTWCRAELLARALGSRSHLRVAA